MKTIVIMSSWNINRIDFTLLRQRHQNLRLVCIANTKLMTDSDTADKLKNFDEVYFVNGVEERFQYHLDAELLIKTVEKELAKNRNLYVLSMCELELDAAASLREALQLPGGNSDLLTQKFRDKYLMKADLVKNNIRVPHYLDFACIKKGKPFFDQIVEKVGLPFIVKPKSSFCSSGVRKINHYDQYLNWFDNDLDTSHAYIFEEFIDGTFFHVDFTLKDGVVIFSDCCEYLHPVMETLNGKTGSSFPLRSDDPLKQSIMDFTHSALNAMSVSTGSYHVEIFKLADGSLCFLEAGARPAGCYIVEIYQYIHGINIFNLDIEVNADLSIDYPGYTDKSYLLWAYVNKKEGVVKKLNNPKLDVDYHMDWSIKVGDVLSQSVDTGTDYVGILRATGTDYAAMYDDFVKLKTFSFLEYDKPDIDSKGNATC